MKPSQEPDQTPISVAICALTYLRPQGIARLLDSLSRLVIPENCTVEVLIVDNDPEGSGCLEVSRHRESVPVPVRCVVESRRGIPAARNRAVRESAPSDFVAFVDDDEACDPRWLVELVDLQRRTGADVVDGRVDIEFEVEPPAWIVEGGFFERPRFPTGQVKNWSTTSSVLVSRDLLDSLEGPFNEAMVLTGGSDTHLFQRARMQGRLMVHSNDSVVTELIPASRTNFRWLVRREFRRGSTLSYCLRDLEWSAARGAKRVAAGLYEILLGLVTLPAALPGGLPALVRSVRHMAFGAGEITGLLGFNPQEYRTIHGS